MTTITKATHPTLFSALQLMDQDNGVINRAEPAQTVYSIRRHPQQVSEIEASLGRLSEENLYNLICGSEDEQEAITHSNNLPSIVIDALREHFEEM